MNWCVRNGWVARCQGHRSSSVNVVRFAMHRKAERELLLPFLHEVLPHFFQQAFAASLFVFVIL